MEFLVHVEVRWPAEGDPIELGRLTASERMRASELVDTGRLRRIWRIPGRRANWGLWRAADATELHDVLASLPLFRWLDIEVFPLGAHPSDPGPSGTQSQKRDD